tara:strand:- start:996 stop:1157 length:162 start_codon:yes stop_codon:yes gene_type:complete
MKDDEKREFYKSLRERIKQLRMEHLFEKQCPPLELDWDDEEESDNDNFIGENI